MPFIPFYFLLLLLGVNWLYNLFDRNRKAKYALKLLIIILATVLGYNYLFKFYKAAFRYDQTKACPYAEYLKAASWIKNDSEKRPARAKIMSKKNTFAYLADADFVPLPYENDWERIIKFALLKNVDYIILDKKSLLRLRKDQWRYLTGVRPQHSRLILVYEDASRENVIKVYEVQP